MKRPPLSAAERHLGTLALLSAALYGGVGAFFAVFPSLTLRLASQGAHVPAGPATRFWHALAVSMMAMLALSCWLASRAPRENRKLLAPVLLSKLVSSVMALAHLASWVPVAPEEVAGRRAVATIIATDFPLFLVTAWFYWRAAPGVNLDVEPAARGEDAAASKPVALGISKAAGAEKPPA